jgi:hypothetical protein
MKQTHFYLLLIASLFIMSACNLDDPNSYETNVISFATVSNPYNTSSFYLVLDNETKTKLYTKDIGTANQDWTPKDGLRVFATYVQLDKASASSGYDYNIKLKSIIEPEKKTSIINLTTDNEASIGSSNDYIINMMYAGVNYLNVLVSYSVTDSEKTHTFTLVKNTTKTYPNDGKTYLELRYNNGGDTQSSTSTSTTAQRAICFDLSSLKGSDGSDLQLEVSATQQGNMVTLPYSTTYKWGN